MVSELIARREVHVSDAHLHPYLLGIIFWGHFEQRRAKAMMQLPSVHAA